MGEKMSDEISLREIRDELGWADQSNQKEIISKLVNDVMVCLNRIEWLEEQVDNLREINQRREQ
jgi:hypothetical protein